MRDEALREELLPLERPFREAAPIYGRRLAWFAVVVVANLVILSCFLLFEVLPVSATVLLGVSVLVWRLLRNRLWRAYPYFSAFVLYIVIRNLALLGLSKLAPGVYQGTYLVSGVVEIGLRFLVVWELFRHTFPSKGFVRSTALSILSIVVSLCTFASQYTQTQSSWFPALDRSMSFIQSLLILTVLVIARYYGIRFGRNIRGITLAFGAWLSLSTANSAMADLDKGFFPYWQIIATLIFLAMLGLWTWAVWAYDPNPLVSPNEQPRSLGQWTETWSPVSAIRWLIYSWKHMPDV
jgi:hypothetical protein